MRRLVSGLVLWLALAGLGLTDLLIRRSANEVTQGLGFQEALFAIEQGSAGEFAGLGQADSKAAEVIQETAHQEGVPVELELHQILAGIAGRRRKIEHQRLFVKTVPPQVPQGSPARWGEVHQGRQEDGQARSRYPHHGHRAGKQGGGGGADGLGH